MNSDWVAHVSLDENVSKRRFVMPVYFSMKIIRNRPGLDYAGPSPSTAWLITVRHAAKMTCSLRSFCTGNYSSI
jgi:hypothetical protein